MNGSRTSITGLFFVVASAVTLAALVGLLSPVVFLAALVGAAALVAVTVADRFSLPATAGWLGSLRLPRTPELGSLVEATFTFSPPGSASRAARLLAPRLRTLTLPSGRLALRRFRDENGASGYRLSVEARAAVLGYERPESIRVLAESALGLWVRLVSVPLSGDGFRVMPPLRRLSPQAFRDLARQERLLAQGTRRQLRSRNAEQFYSVRKYQYPDSIRHLDPRKTAKFGELMTRVYDAFYNHHLVLGLDVGRAMLGRIDGSPRREYCLAACLNLAQHAVTSQDRVSFFAFSRALHYAIRDTRSTAAFAPLFEGDPRLDVREEDTDFDLVPPTVQHLAGRRSLVLLFTDPARPSVQERLHAILPSLCARHLVVVVGLVDDRYQLDRVVSDAVPRPSSVEDYNRYLYACWLDEQLERFRLQTAGLSGGCLLVTPKDWMAVVRRLYGLMRESLRM